ncbi:MAG TPA: ABC transporter ATP-binding protein [Pirellulales bacterium]|nr:ABC transporter ATP-binding protein [Pirellulales bacterium]
MNAALRCVDVVKRFGEFAALDGVEWSVPAGQVVGLMGSSGAGKTTLLRILAGLSRCTSGKIEFPDSLSGSVPRVGMVFQNLALWPHLTALRHLTCVLSQRPRSERRRQAEAMLEEVRLPPMAWNRRPDQLSGGEAQRLALARALAAEPSVLLLDEPLAHLDAALKNDLQTLILRLAEANGITLIYVTHAWAEAAQLCSQIAVLDRGRMAQSAAPAELFFAPVNRQTALLSGPLVELPRSWFQAGAIACQAETPASVSILPSEECISVRPQQLRLTIVSERNCWRITKVCPTGAGWVAKVQNGDCSLELLLPEPPASSEMGVEICSVAQAAGQASLHLTGACATSNVCQENSGS